MSTITRHDGPLQLDLSIRYTELISQTRQLYLLALAINELIIMNLLNGMVKDESHQ